MADDDQQLAARIRSGEVEAFDTLFERYAPHVLGFALRLTGSRSEAEDLVQDVFLAAYSGRHAFQGRSKLLTWLLGIAVRRWRDQCRRDTPQTVPWLSDEAVEASSADVLQPGACQPRSPLEDNVINALTLDKALARLEAPFREALLLVGSHGLTYREAAAVLGEPMGTVQWRVSQAMSQMRRLLNVVEEEFHEI